MKDNFLNEDECDSLIKSYKDNNDKVKTWRYTFPMPIGDAGYLLNKLNRESIVINNSVLDWAEIVRWPIGSKQDLHYDTSKNNTVLSSIIYLNDTFEGGQTYFKDGVSISPKKGRALFFDGCYYEHGVSEVKKLDRFTLASWFKKIQN
jgi:hypothetical protein